MSITINLAPITISKTQTKEIKDFLVDYMDNTYDKEVVKRLGYTFKSLAKEMIADPDFNASLTKRITSLVESYVEEILHDPYSFDNNLLDGDDPICPEWIARLDQAQEEYNHEIELLEEAQREERATKEMETRLADAVTLLKKAGFKITEG